MSEASDYIFTALCMDSLFGTLSLGFLLRSFFAGGFFMLSYLSAKLGMVESCSQITADTRTLVLTIFAGVTVYGFHRSMLYPFVEYLFDTRRAKRLRKKYPLISDATLSDLKDRWDRGEELNKVGSKRASKISSWADLAHMQYVSSLCIMAGAVVAKMGGKLILVWSYPLVTLTVVLFFSALVSDWRLHAVEDFLRSSDPKVNPSGNNNQLAAPVS